MLGGDRLNHLRLLYHAVLSAVEFQPQCRRDRQASFEYLLIASICTGSASSILATGTPDWMVLITTLTAASTLGKEQTADEIAAGTP
jgi:hypothetical protein